MQSYINSPTISRKTIVEAIQTLNEPLPGVYVRSLRKAYEAFTTGGDIASLLTAIATLEVSTATGAEPNGGGAAGTSMRPVQREELRLICFDFVWS